MVYPGLRRNRLKWSKRRVAFSKYLLDRCTHTHIHTQHIHTRTHDTMQGPLGLLGTRPFCIPQFFNLIYFIYLFLVVLKSCILCIHAKANGNHLIRASKCCRTNNNSNHNHNTGTLFRNTASELGWHVNKQGKRCSPGS